MKKIILALVLLCFTAVAQASISWSLAKTVYYKLITSNKFSVSPKLILNPNSAIQAKAYVNAIYVYSGMLKSVRNADEMAWVLGHELAHIKLWHTSSGHPNEYAADKFGVRLANNAGYNGCKGARILLRWNLPDALTHPSSVKRFKALHCG